LASRIEDRGRIEHSIQHARHSARLLFKRGLKRRLEPAALRSVWTESVTDALAVFYQRLAPAHADSELLLEVSKVGWRPCQPSRTALIAAAFGQMPRQDVVFGNRGPELGREQRIFGPGVLVHRPPLLNRFVHQACHGQISRARQRWPVARVAHHRASKGKSVRRWIPSPKIHVVVECGKPAAPKSAPISSPLALPRGAACLRGEPRRHLAACSVATRSSSAIPAASPRPESRPSAFTLPLQLRGCPFCFVASSNGIA
jgi:hypothetical protein